MARSLAELQQAVNHVKSSDARELGFRTLRALVRARPGRPLMVPKLPVAGVARLVEEHGLPLKLLQKHSNCFQSLVRSIIAQQLAGSAVKSIFDRFMRLCGVRLAPLAHLRLDDDNPGRGLVAAHLSP
jgi:hypothetical protein